MVVDTSALLAILFGEPERAEFIERMSAAGVRLVGSVSALEAAIVVECRKGPAGVRELDLLMHAAHLDVVPFDSQQLLLAREAYQRYGKGRHVANLNLGDCC